MNKEREHLNVSSYIVDLIEKDLGYGFWIVYN